MKITENFNLNEFMSKDGAPMPQDVLSNIITLAKQMQVIRDKVGKPIRINSGYRSPEHNAKIGGVKNSQHVLGKACDFVIIGKTTQETANIVEKLINKGKIMQGGLGRYSSFTHYDIRGKKARWML